MIHSREDLKLAQRIVIKAGTSVVSNQDGYPSLTRMASIVECAGRLARSGKEVIIVTSGAVGVGRQRLAKQTVLHRSVSDLLANRDPAAITSVVGLSLPGTYNCACAAAGQLGLMSLYETMFTQYDITVSQLLVTSFDFTSVERRRNIQHVLTQLLALGIIPLINENDAIYANQGYETFGKSFSDNDSLAALVSVEMSAHLLLLLTDVNGVYDRPPSDPEAKVIDIFQHSTEFVVGSKSMQGRGGMGAKVDAAMKAITGGVAAVVIASGYDPLAIGQVLTGQRCGTLFLQPQPVRDIASPSSPSTAASSFDQTICISTSKDGLSNGLDLRTLAQDCRQSSRSLAMAPGEMRKKILLSISQKLLDQADQILEINAQDVTAAESSGMSKTMIARLKLSLPKLENLSSGIERIALMEDPIAAIQGQWKVAEDLLLQKVACPIGVLLVIFESRPDCLPQIAALSIKSGNGLILKGGKEAQLTNQYLHTLITTAIQEASQGEISSTVVSLINTREEVKDLLSFGEGAAIDLVIPRGSNELVQSIMRQTKIPVMGHADGVCHLYVDAAADPIKAQRIICDAKLDYPAACNAVETLLFHRNHITSGLMEKVLLLLRKEGVIIFGSDRVKQEGLCEQLVTDFHQEYGDLRVSVEIVDSLSEAIDHIHRYGSGHTEGVISEEEQVVREFLAKVDSACVFANSSTRFADGFRFGLGAEVGISTSRIHARGPVGVEGLLGYKWWLKSTAAEGHVAASHFSPVVGSQEPVQYLHQKLV